MASSSSSSSKGLVKKSTAPAFMAFTVIGISPYAVRKMTGTWIPAFLRRCWNSRPFIPGRLTSNIRQLGPSAGSFCRNRSAVSNPSDRKPADFSRPRIDARTPASSSMTNTVGAPANASCSPLVRVPSPQCGVGRCSQHHRLAVQARGPVRLRRACNRNLWRSVSLVTTHGKGVLS